MKKQLQSGSGAAWLAGFLFLALVAVIIGGYWYYMKHPGSTTTTTMSSTNCATSNLGLSVGTSEGAAGTIYTHMVITNNGASSCTLTGYPTVYLTDASAAVVGGGAAPNPLYAPAAITLASHGTAHTVVGFPQAGNFDPGVCSAKSVNIEVYPPASTTAISVADAQQSCPGFSATALQSGS